LATKSVDDKHTGDCIQKNVCSVPDEYHAANSGNVYVTDNATNMKASFTDNILDRFLMPQLKPGFIAQDGGQS
jgi:hypothetical protein